MNNRSILHSTLSRIDPQRITVGREMRGLTKKALAKKIGKTPSAITQFESGKSGLDIDTFGSLVIALGLPPKFFTKNANGLDVDFSTCHFRANKSVSQFDRRKALRHSLTIVETYRVLENYGVVFPTSQVSTYTSTGYSPASVETLAKSIRRGWSLGDGPIQNMAALLESKGVFVIILPSECEKLHAFSFWAEDRPCIVITKSVSASHMQFDQAHELAHLILHMEESAGDPESERTANHFAGAFLAPAQSFRVEFPRVWDLELFLNLKKRWHISIQAALYRGRQLDIIKESRFRWAMIDLGRNEIRTNEPGEFSKPLPLLLTKALELIVGEIYLDNLADDIGISVHEFEELLISQLIPEYLIESLKRPEPIYSDPNVIYLRNK